MLSPIYTDDLTFILTTGGEDVTEGEAGYRLLTAGSDMEGYDIVGVRGRDDSILLASNFQNIDFFKTF